MNSPTVREGLGGAKQATQQAFLRSKEDYFRFLADLLIVEGRLPEAEQVLRMLKEQEYYGFIRRDAEHDPRQSLSTLNSMEAQQQKRLERPSQALAALWGELQGLYRIEAEVRTAQEQLRIETLERQTAAARDAFYSALDQVYAAFAADEQVVDRERFGELQELVEKAEPDKAGLQRRLEQLSGRRVALVQYLMMPDKLHILVNIGKARRHFEVRLGAADLNLAIQAFRDPNDGPLVQPGRDPVPQARWLYQQLIAPIADELQAGGVEMLMFYLDGALRYLPMAALHDGEGYLIERYGLAVYTGVNEYNLVDSPSLRPRVAAFGVSEGHRRVGPSRRDFGRLPGVPAELEGIVKRSARDADGVAPGQVYLDPEFTRAALNRVLREARYPVIHLATHFALESSDDASFLLLGDGSTLTLRELRHHAVFSNVDLLTLSACDTAVELGGYAGREIEGLGRVMQEKDAKGVIATLWPVEDASTGLLMRTLYRLRQEQGLTKADALRQAQLSLLHGTDPEKRCDTARGTSISLKSGQSPSDSACRWNHPYYWAPFILMGNWL